MLDNHRRKVLDEDPYRCHCSSIGSLLLLQAVNENMFFTSVNSGEFDAQEHKSWLKSVALLKVLFMLVTLETFQLSQWLVEVGSSQRTYFPC